MDHTNGVKTKLGIFVVVAVALFMAGIYLIGSRHQLFNRTLRVSCVFKNVYGLQAGNSVRFSGINIGTVETIDIINDSMLRVDMQIDDRIRKFIKTDAKANIGSEGLMGNKVMNISPGSGGQPEIKDNGFIETVTPIGIDDILMQLKATSDDAASVASDLAAMISQMRAGKGTIGQLVMDTTFFKDSRERATRITNDLSIITSALASGKGTLGKLIMDSTFLESANESMAQVSEVFRSVRAGKGTLGMLMMDSAFALKIDSTLFHIDQGAVEFRRSMEKAHKSLLLWGLKK
ncbi:MAG: hypothetical protein A2268_11285 [Candidatus Raymondbacteria bacterium RifOxyA12_full_50_37]|uniref:Mce/MlaD domain-containing protein n=1 Tax=Candidatus Raymondbacteria bacterium RIFOXYD12_FULL_49_13 TaxID=1817890 RepID=A0A1F7FAM2_UNCRA|nr:MAG: hypothetical protein A2268_11285 [Candidatus Raymondbacteria bacterium RifOxyA12_full_50_37]OGJ92356.1 MAG: hypothetical protein A2248_10410 [Candidatus Raymondbacteria bacterium RIFOXYA2_FULL_49_16]OGJ96158.1 MAG: hypothetical protein A2350_17520 [Candidatus Raymondbacteria bacterium RifOxyB12_full_50_8]OGJ99337.1 MAG: hypothetical protein A2453_13470 [Candidatus Raymondbacteria bacterium RIFOXYC2_FULL_50_21]OGK03648.1 MAG: hypothetical protein A2519_02655 [Candidatus Raymondbacteria b